MAFDLLKPGLITSRISVLESKDGHSETKTLAMVVVVVVAGVRGTR